MKNKTIACLLLLANGWMLSAQDSLLSVLAAQHVEPMTLAGGQLNGPGWDKIRTEAKASSQVLVGEDHFSNEIPRFVAQLAREVHFDNFFCEIDPFSAETIEQHLKNQSKPEAAAFLKKYRNTFSFYALEPEFRLLEQLIQAKVNIAGTEQIALFADRLVCGQLAKETNNARAKALYQNIEKQSELHLARFLKDQSQPMYMFTPDFEKDLAALFELKLSARETEQLEGLKLSRRIYQEQNHALRIQLMKQQLLKHHVALTQQKNLFKYGAVHMPRGESLLKIYDLGNVIQNFADSRFERSLHLMIVGKNGKLGSPFEGMPGSELDPENGDLKFLKPFFRVVEGDSWQCFDLGPLRREVEQGNIVVPEKMLLRTIMGYDYLIVIPTVSAAGI